MSDDKITVLRMLTEADPGDAATWFLLGRELVAAGRPGEAVAAFRGAIAAQPDYAAAFRQLGNALEAAGRTDEAVATYRDGILRVELPLVQAEERRRSVPIDVPARAAEPDDEDGGL